MARLLFEFPANLTGLSECGCKFWYFWHTRKKQQEFAKKNVCHKSKFYTLDFQKANVAKENLRFSRFCCSLLISFYSLRVKKSEKIKSNKNICLYFSNVCEMKRWGFLQRLPPEPWGTAASDSNDRSHKQVAPQARPNTPSRWLTIHPLRSLRDIATYFNKRPKQEGRQPQNKSSQSSSRNADWSGNTKLKNAQELLVWLVTVWNSVIGWISTTNVN